MWRNGHAGAESPGFPEGGESYRRRRWRRLPAACIARPLPVQSPYASAIPDRETGTLVNDVHSQLNATHVGAIVKPRGVADVRAAIAAARAAGRAISVAGGRHAMGGQQFGEGHLLLDMRGMNRVLAFDAENGSITVEGGIQWPQLLDHLDLAQEGRERQWGIYQKQTGADRLSIAGALSCNAHGRGLTLGPIVQQVESFDLVGSPRRGSHVLADRAMPSCFASPSADTGCSASSPACS